MERIDDKTSAVEPGDNKSYKRIELVVNGKPVYALFPEMDTDTGTMPLIQDILISSYVNAAGIKKKNHNFSEDE